MKRIVVGAHQGTGSWLAQRISAVVMALYTVIVLVVLLRDSPATHGAWQALLAQGWMRVATLLFAVSLAWHAWVGVRDIFMDYVKPDGLRLALHVLVALVLAAYLGWGVEILWR